ncbi:hypothetical protein BDV32DRAFT_139333 [Aspergillus pseudonomiae]|nr:hypothetical protein BDV32DRAFT_139333 [Aspergillus pseudonomiae]
MTVKEDIPIDDSHRAPHDSSDPPPAYSPRASSIASSETSLWTVEPDFAPDFTNTFQQGSDCATVCENQQFITDPGSGSRTSAFIQAFLRPKAQPRLINLQSDSHSLLEDGPSDRQPRSELRGAPLDIVIMVVGENIEPFVAVGTRLLRDSHRVRIAAHASCETLVKDQGLDFFAISYDMIHPLASGPSRMNEGPGSIKGSLYQSYHNSWRACIASYKGERRPFLADAIIANPLAHAHIHCAERLSIPLHIMSTVIWKGSEAMDQGMTNILSYALIEETIWNTIIEPINRFRQHVLGLNSISSATGGRLIIDNEVPHTYFCPEVLVSRPSDWGSMISSPPIYFMVREHTMETPGMLARAIQDTVVKRGLRAILSQDCRDICRILNHNDVFLVDNIPHAWLMPRVAVVVHSGSADHSALALRYGKPSVVIPHTTDQLSRGISLSCIGAAAAPLTSNVLSSDVLYQALEFCLRADIQESTRVVQRQVHDESGLKSAIQAFYRWLPPQVQKCDITNQNLAMYQIWNKPSSKISPEAAAVLLEERLIKQTDIVLITRQAYNIQCESSRPFKDTARDYWNGATTAAKNIATASDLVSMLPRMQRKPKRKNLAKDVGIGTARFFGNIALLPFTTRDEEHAEAICRRHLDRGFKSPMLKNPDFRRLVINKYQSWGST